MDQQGKVSSKVPLFNGEDYAFWRIRMRIHLMSIGLDVWLSVEKGYKYPKSPPTDPEEIKQFGNKQKLLMQSWSD